MDVWTVPLDEPREQLLSPAEQARASRFRFERDRLRWTHAHSALRAILADYLKTPPLEIAFTLGVHGKPATEGLEFNLSHAGAWAMIAVCDGTPVGVDVELIRANVEMAALLRRIGETEVDGPLAELFQVWTRREARIKAVGGALMDDPEGDFRVIDLIAPAGYAASLALLGLDPEVNYRGGV